MEKDIPFKQHTRVATLISDKTDNTNIVSRDKDGQCLMIKVSNKYKHICTKQQYEAKPNKREITQ